TRKSAPTSRRRTIAWGSSTSSSATRPRPGRPSSPAPRRRRPNSPSAARARPPCWEGIDGRPMAEELRDRAIVLGVVDYGESDRIVTLLTREHGKIGAFARGGRASRRRFAGALLPFTLLEVRLVPRRGDLFGLSSCVIEEAFVGLRDSLEAISLAGYAAELCRELCKE